jgi:hypothetical protein
MKGEMGIYLKGIISKGGEIGNVWMGVSRVDYFKNSNFRTHKEPLISRHKKTGGVIQPRLSLATGVRLILFRLYLHHIHGKTYVQVSGVHGQASTLPALSVARERKLYWWPR